MRYEAIVEPLLGQVAVGITSNCYTDSFPLLRRLLFRKIDVDPTIQALPLACAVLSTRYCGEQFEFAGTKIGGDYAEAIRCILGPEVNIANVDGQNRRLSSAEIDVFSTKALADSPHWDAPRQQDTVPMARIEWSGDFVNRATRTSDGYCFGTCHTNAQLFATDACLSIAVGLLHGRDRTRNLYVPVASEAEASQLIRFVTALRIVSINLHLVPAALRLAS